MKRAAFCSYISLLLLVCTFFGCKQITNTYYNYNIAHIVYENPKGDAPNQIEVPYNAVLSSHELQQPITTDPYSKFIGWYYKNEHVKPGFIVTEDIVLTARFSNNSISGDGDKVNVYVTPKPGFVDANTTIDVSVNNCNWYNIYFTTDGTEPTTSSLNFEQSEIKVGEEDLELKLLIITDSETIKKTCNYQVKKYSINFRTDGYTDEPLPPITGLIPHTNVELPILKLDGYRFQGWTRPTESYVRTSITINRNDEILIPSFIPLESDDYFVKISHNGFVDYNQTVSLSCITRNASIYYTTDGSVPDPTNEKQLYTSPITVDREMTIRAVSTDNKGNNSTYESRAHFYIKKYNVDFHSEGFDLSSKRISNLKKGDIIPLDSFPKLERKGYLFEGWGLDHTKTVITKDYTVYDDTIIFAKWKELEKLCPVRFNKIGNVDYKDTITLSAPNPKNVETDIYYTMDYSDPLINGILYTKPIEITDKCTIRAVSTKEGYAPSDESYGSFNIITYTIDFVDDEKVIQSKTGLYKGEVLKQEDLPVIEKNNYRFLGWKSNGTILTDGYEVIKDSSLIADWEQIISVGDLEISKVGQVDYGTPVTITCKTPEAKIYYTTDGSVPSKLSYLYEKPIIITDDTVINAIAFVDDIHSPIYSSNILLKRYTLTFVNFEKCNGVAEVKNLYKGYKLTPKDFNLSVERENYKFDGWYFNDKPLTENYVVESDIIATAYWRPFERVQEVVPSVAGGAYDYEDTISLKTQTPGATIYFTTDGSEPSRNSFIYKNPIVLKEDMVIKAYAAKNDMQPSNVITHDYTVLKYSVTFWENFHGEVKAPIENLNKNSTLSEDQLYMNDSSDGYKFIKWVNMDDNSEFTTSSVILNDVRLKAIWEKQ